MLGIVVAAFALSWFPLYATFTRLKFTKGMTETEAEFWEMLMPLAQWLSSANSCVNPLLYHFLDPRFRSGFKQLLCSNGGSEGGQDGRQHRALNYLNAAATATPEPLCPPLRARFHHIQQISQTTAAQQRYGNEWV